MDPEFYEQLQQQRITQTQASDSQQNDRLPLPPPSESLVGANTAVFDDQPPSPEQIPTNDPFPAVPAELKARRQWVVWRNETRDGKPTKVPYQVNGRKAQSNQADTWTDYQTVCTHRDRFSGIGFVFSEDDLYCGIDLDDCLYRDENGKIQIKPWAQPIVDMLMPIAYAEVSPSGKGIKFWIRAKLLAETKHRAGVEDGGIEVYDNRRYFTVTGRGKGTIGDGQAVTVWALCGIT